MGSGFVERSPFETIGLNKLLIQTLKRDPAELRKFVQAFRRSSAPYLHPDTSEISQRQSAEVNNAFGRLLSADLKTLSQMADEYISGPAEQQFGIRLDLQRTNEEKERLREELRSKEKALTEQTAELEQHSTLLANTLGIFLESIYRDNGDGNLFSPRKLRGHCFFSFVSRNLVGKSQKKGQTKAGLILETIKKIFSLQEKRRSQVKSIQAGMAYLQPDGILIARNVQEKFPRPVRSNTSRHQLRKKVLAIAKALRKGQLVGDWEELGFLIGFTLPEHAYRLPTSPMELEKIAPYLLSGKLRPAIDISRITKTSENDSLVCLKPFFTEEGIRFAFRYFSVPTHNFLRPFAP